MPKFNPTIEGVNGRLKAAGIRLRLERRGNKLSLVGTLPLKKGEGKKQQRISLGHDFSPHGIRMAERSAMEVWVHLQNGTFSWDDYTSVVDSSFGTFGYWIDEYKVKWFAKRGSLEDVGLNRLWVSCQFRFLRDLPMLEVVNVDRLIEFAQIDPMNSAGRRDRVNVYCFFLRTAGFKQSEIEPLRQLVGNYGYSKVKQRVLPSDDEIVLARSLISNPSWLLVYDLMALYGLRNHEVFRSEVELNPPYALRVLSGKTHSRYPVLPLHRYWADEWEPWRDVELPRLKLNHGNAYLGSSVTKAFLRYGIPFSPYSLRHAYAIRATVIYRIPDTVSAKMMGHSVQLHNRIYHEWISHSQILDIYNDVTRGQLGTD